MFSGHIIAILAAILFPVFARAREKARQTSCLSNLKQLGTALLMYAQDYDETYCSVYFYHKEPLGLTFWQELLQPYIMNEQVQICPSDQWNYPHTDPPFDSSYAFSSIGANRAGETCAKLPGSKMALVQDVAGTIALCDSTTAEIFGPWSSDPDPLVFTELGRLSRVAEVHNEGANYAFADGHGKWLKDTQPGMWTSLAGD